MNPEEQILEVLRTTLKPMSAGQIADISGIDRKIVDKAMTKLKTEDKITSPQRCFWTAK